MNLCEKCGSQLQDGQIFCVTCGTKIQPKPSQPFCPICGNPLQPNQMFCNMCGNRMQPMKSFCPKCGMEIQPGQMFCPYCSTQVANTNSMGNMSQPTVEKKKTTGYIPAFILGLIGSVFGILGGICVSACYSFTGNDTAPMVMIIGGSLIGMVGACIGFNFPLPGAVLEIAGTLLMSSCVFTITGADIMTLLAIALLGISGIIALIMSFVNK